MTLLSKKTYHIMLQMKNKCLYRYHHPYPQPINHQPHYNPYEMQQNPRKSLRTHILLYCYPYNNLEKHVYVHKLELYQYERTPQQL